MERIALIDSNATYNSGFDGKTEIIVFSFIDAKRLNGAAKHVAHSLVRKNWEHTTNNVRDLDILRSKNLKQRILIKIDPSQKFQAASRIPILEKDRSALRPALRPSTSLLQRFANCFGL